MKVVLVTVLSAGALVAGAAEWKSAALNCSFEYPDGWTQIASPAPIIKAAVQSPTKNETIVLIVVDSPGTQSGMSDEFVAGVKGGYARQGGVIVSDRRCEMGGLPAFEMVGRNAAPGGTTSTLMHSTIADGKAYTLQIVDADGDVTADTELLGTLDTFHFLRAPSPPGRPRSVAYRMGYWIGRMSMYGALLGVITYFVVRGIQSGRRPRQGPPALPR